MVAAPCRAPASAARWNGHAPHTATGDASVRQAHCQPGKCQAGTIPSTTTGTASASETGSRPGFGGAGSPPSRGVTGGSPPGGQHSGVAGLLDRRD